MFPKEWADSASLDTHCITSLNKLYKKNILADGDSEEVIKVLEHIKNEYAAVNKESKETLAKLHLLPVNLPKSTQSILQKAYEIEDMELNPRKFGQNLEQSLLAVEKIKTKKITERIWNTNEQLRNLIEKINKELKLGNEETTELKDAQEKNNDNLVFFKLKDCEYTEKLANIQKKLCSYGINDTGLCTTLLNTIEETKLKKKQIAKLDAELKQYDELPPDLAAAKDRLAKASAELDTLNRELKKKIADTLKL